MKQITAIFEKDIKSEFRTRYAISAVLLFILVTVTMILFSTSSEKITTGMASAFLWIIMFFASMTGLSKSFVSEEERGTGIALKTIANSSSIYFGKLLFNVLLSITLNYFTVLLFFLFIEVNMPENIGIFILTIFIGSLGIASATTIISALLAKANTKNALFPILSFPILIPVIILGIELTKYSFHDTGRIDPASNINLIIAYCGLMIVASYFLFDFVWED